MALIIPHQSQQGIATAGGGQAASYRGASEFMTPGQQNFGKGLQQLAAGLDKLNGVMLEQEVERRQQQISADLLADQNAEKEAFQAFDADYKKNNRGASARDATDVYNTYFDKRHQDLQKKWGGNPRLMRAADQMFAPIRQGGLSGALQYSVSEEEYYEKQELAAAEMNAMRDAADFSMPYDVKFRSLADMEESMRMLARGRNIEPEVSALRQKFALEHTRSLVASGRFGDAKSFVETNKGMLGDKADGALMQIKSGMEIAERRAEAAAERNERLATADAVKTAYADIWGGVQGLEPRQMLAEGMKLVNETTDVIQRARLAELLKNDVALRELQNDAEAYVEYSDLVKANPNATPASLSALAESQNLSPGARALLAKGSEAPTKETYANVAALSEGRRLFDSGSLQKPEDRAAFSYRHGLTPNQFERLDKYAADGGNRGGLKQADIDKAYQLLDPGKEKAPDGWFDLVADSLEPGKSVTPDSLKKILAILSLSGTLDKHGIMLDSFPLHTAISRGLTESWEVNATPSTLEKIKLMMKSAGVPETDITEQSAKKYISDWARAHTARSRR